jgi:phospholipid transport system transporter-binding protein
MLVLPAILTHAESAALAPGLKQSVLAEPLELVVDASALQEFDSSALALLLASRREALAAGKGFSVKGLPTRLHELASLYGVAALIPAAV